MCIWVMAEPVGESRRRAWALDRTNVLQRRLATKLKPRWDVHLAESRRFRII